MRKNKLLLLLGSICLVVTLAAIPFMAACAKPAQEKPIKIGALVLLTGPVPEWGPRHLACFEVALEEVNYEVAGRPIELIVEDEMCPDVSAALEKAKKLVLADKVDVLVGPFHSSSKVAVGPWTSSVPIVNMFYNEPSVDKAELDCKYSFWSSYTYSDNTYPLGLYAYDELGIRTVTTIGSDYDAGHQFVGGFTDAFTARGGQVLQQLWVPFGEMDFTPYLTALNTDADALVNGILTPPSIMAFMPPYEAMGFWEKVPIFIRAEAGFGLSSAERAEIGPRLIGVIGPQRYIVTADNPENQKFLAAYRAKKNEDPDDQAANAYAGMKAVLAALEATGGDTNPDVLKQAMLKVELDLPTGHFSFNPGRMAIGDTNVCQIGPNYEPMVLKTYPQWETYVETYP